MQPIKIAVIFDQIITVGGGYQQSINAALLTKKIDPKIAKSIYFTTHEDNLKNLEFHGIKAILIKLNFFQKIHVLVRRRIINPRLLNLIKIFGVYNPFEKKLINHKIDLVYALSPSSWILDLENLNYISTVWDLSHRDEPEFPEVRQNKEFENREFLYNKILPKSFAVFADSLVGKQNLIRRYNLDHHRVQVMPFQAGNDIMNYGKQSKININKKYDLKYQYLFYPAQFWAHKNHIYILDAISLLEKKYKIKIGAIFCGQDKGNLNYVMKYASDLKISQRIKFIGFVDKTEIADLYIQSIALVMPTYFGPTNLPPLEAFELGVPVIYSNIAGLKEQVDSSAILIDLNNVETLVLKIKLLLKDNKFSQNLISKGRKRLRFFDSIDRAFILNEIIYKFYIKRKTWN